MDSDTEKEITAFVAGRAPALLRTAYALCGDRHTAEDLVQNALAKAASRWSTIRGEPENYVRSVLYREFLSGWRRRRRRPETCAGTAAPCGRINPAAQINPAGPTKRAAATDREPPLEG